jgi:hypothetical protein
MVEREWIGCLVFKLATTGLPINTNPYTHNPPMKEHSAKEIERPVHLFTRTIRYLWSNLIQERHHIAEIIFEIFSI